MRAAGGTTGARLLIDALVTHGTTMAFEVPGESYLAALDALYDVRSDLRLIVCRQEGGATYMADAYGKLTGKPGIAFVTRGPGAANAAVGVHTARQDSTPMILFIGQVARSMADREAFQEVDFRRMYGQLAKWVAQIDRPERVPEYIAHAFQVATSGRPGPVVLALPEDMLAEETTPPSRLPGQYRAVQASPGAEDLATLRGWLEAAERPLIVLGGPTWTPEAVADITAFAEAWALPVSVSFRAQDCLDNRHRCYVGDIGIGINPKLAARVRETDLMVVLGPRLGEMTTGGYTLLEPPRLPLRLVHVHPGAEEPGHVYQPDLGIVAGMPQMARALRALAPPAEPRWRARTADMRSDYLENMLPVPTPGDVNPSEVVAHLNRVMPEDVIVTNGAGNFSGWAHRFFQYRRYRSQLAPTNGSMGYGVPSGVAAKLAAPDRTVISFNGDGCFLMNGQELATAVQHGAAPIFLVFNNGMYGTIRMHQEREYPGRVHGTSLVNPDFVAYAQAFGAHGERVTKTADFPEALERAQAAGRAAVIELAIDPEAITSRTTLSRIREQALAGQG
ncbi:MAG: thiamine pyrophosphate-binding protein [Rhodospirillaceae bacterium]|nr:thiamine pyrophosphate-binding protein [Rhodospirillaceae bacterium]